MGRFYATKRPIFLLGSLNNPSEVAANLYKVLRQLDQEKIPLVYVDIDFPQEGLWLTIAERLQRAAS